MSAHTPGPWVWVEAYESAYLVPVVEYQKDPEFPGSYAIADDGSAGGEYSQKIDPHGADATLIAASPDLLEACEAHMAALASKIRDGKDRPEYAEAIYQAQKKMDAAIKKARGGA